MEFINRNPKIFIISGKAKSGKDLVANIICELYKDKKCKKLSFAYYLKHYTKNILNWDGKEETKPRDFLQQFGIDFIKNKIDNNFLIKRMCEDIDIYSYFYDVLVITDARLVEEIDIIKEKYDNSLVLRINGIQDNGLTIEQKNHITETNLDNYDNFDYIIENNGDCDKLIKEVENVIGVDDHE